MPKTPWYTEEQVELATHVIPTDLIGSGIHVRCLVRDILDRVTPPGTDPNKRYPDDDEIIVPALLVQNINMLQERINDAIAKGNVFKMAHDWDEINNEIDILISWHPDFDSDRGRISNDDTEIE